jgi:hypothetical protein
MICRKAREEIRNWPAGEEHPDTLGPLAKEIVSRPA